MAKIMRWDPYRTLQSQIDRLFENTLFHQQPGNTPALTAWAPNVDIRETPNELVLEADLPGLEEKDLDVRVENNMLTIGGERKFESKVSEDDYMRLERSYGSFSRSFALPPTVEPEKIRAEYRNGVLSVRLPKREEAKPKQIKVSVDSAK
jgi:HSP20 family protein